MVIMKKSVFICGCPRSGTTLLGSLLGASRTNVATPESQFIIDISRKLARSEIGDGHSDIKDELINNFRFKLWNIDREFQALPSFESESVFSDLVWRGVDFYAKKNGKESWDAWIDHTPTHVSHINYLSNMFTESYFIHLIRDGRGVYSSVKALDWGPAGVISGAKWWTQRIAPGLAAERAIGDRIIRVRFEDLVCQPEKELRRICGFIGIEFSLSMLDGSGFSVPKYTQGQHESVGKPPDESISGKWKNDLSIREIEIFESISGSLLGYLGYEIMFGFTAKKPNIFERLRDILISIFIRNFSKKIYRLRRRMKV